MMPFLQQMKSEIKVEHSPFYQEIKHLFAPLQVRIPWYNAGKKALSWASLKASLSLEAALVLPLFLFACFCLMMPMRMMNRQRQIQAVVEDVGEELSQYAYVVRCLEAGDEDSVDVSRREGQGSEDTGSGAGSTADGIYIVSEAYAAGSILARINQEWVEDVSFAETEIGQNNMVHIVMRYRMRLPFSVLGLGSLPFESVCSRRMWTGAEGNRWGGTGGNLGQEEELVYIGKTSTRYHVRRDCHYLSNALSPVSASAVGELRNKEGKRYHACQACGGGSGTVYVSDYGTSYHTSPNCRAILSYVQAVPLSQVFHMGACSYCGGR